MPIDEHSVNIVFYHIIIDAAGVCKSIRAISKNKIFSPLKAPMAHPYPILALKLLYGAVIAELNHQVAELSVGETGLA